MSKETRLGASPTTDEGDQRPVATKRLGLSPESLGPSRSAIPEGEEGAEVQVLRFV